MRAGEHLARHGAWEFDLHVGQRRCLDLAEQCLHLALHFRRASDVGEGAASEPRRLAHEVTVRRRADPDREEPALAEALPDHIEELLLVADLAIGQEDDLPQPTVRLAGVEGLGERREHLGAAPGPQTVDVAIRESHVRGGRGLRRRKHAIGHRVELDDC
jgi:hypothetical protein